MKKIKYRMRHYNYKCPNPKCGVEGTIETDVVITSRPKCKNCGKRKVEWTEIIEFGLKKEAKKNEPPKESKPDKKKAIKKKVKKVN